jgi:hypothetical protein
VSNSIDRQAAIEAVQNRHIMLNKEKVLLIKDLEKLPPVEPQRIRAEWIAITSLQDGQIALIDFKCSNCSHHSCKPMNFCEVCGAKMDFIEIPTDKGNGHIVSERNIVPSTEKEGCL